MLDVFDFIPDVFNSFFFTKLCVLECCLECERVHRNSLAMWNEHRRNYIDSDFVCAHARMCGRYVHE